MKVKLNSGQDSVHSPVMEGGMSRSLEALPLGYCIFQVLMPGTPGVPLVPGLPGRPRGPAMPVLEQGRNGLEAI